MEDGPERPRKYKKKFKEMKPPFGALVLKCGGGDGVQESDITKINEFVNKCEWWKNQKRSDDDDFTQLQFKCTYVVGLSDLYQLKKLVIATCIYVLFNLVQMFFCNQRVCIWIILCI